MEQDHYEKHLADEEEVVDDENNGYYDEETGEWVPAAPGEVFDEWGTLIKLNGVVQGYYEEESGEWVQTAEYDEWGTLIGGGVVEEEETQVPPPTGPPTDGVQQQDGVPDEMLPAEPGMAEELEGMEEEEEAVPDVVMAEPQPSAIAPPPSADDAKKKQQQEAIDKDLKAAQDAAKAAGDAAKNLIGGIGGSLFGGGGGAKKGGGLGGMFGAVAQPKKPAATPPQVKSPPKAAAPTKAGDASPPAPEQAPEKTTAKGASVDSAEKAEGRVAGEERKSGAQLAGAVQVLPAPTPASNKEGDVDAAEAEEGTRANGEKFLPDNGKPRFVKHINKTRTMSGRQKWDWAFEKIIQVGRKERPSIFCFAFVSSSSTTRSFVSPLFLFASLARVHSTLSPVLLDNLFISLVCFHYFANDLFKSPLVQQIDVYAPQPLVSALKCVR